MNFKKFQTHTTNTNSQPLQMEVKIHQFRKDTNQELDLEKKLDT